MLSREYQYTLRVNSTSSEMANNTYGAECWSLGKQKTKKQVDKVYTAEIRQHWIVSTTTIAMVASE